MKTLKERHTVVTDGSRGLGLGIVEALVEQQAIVTIVARDLELLDHISKRAEVALYVRLLAPEYKFTSVTNSDNTTYENEIS